MRCLRLLPALLLLPLVAVAPGAAARPEPTRFAATVLEGGGGEPNVSISPDGRTVIVSGLAASPATLYRSTDGGRRFSHLRPRFESAGGGDWDMRWLDNNTIVAVDLALDEGILVHRSTDRGTTWTTTQIQIDVFDRPWLDHFGTNLVYVAAKGFDGIPYLFTSRDGGRTFGSPPQPVLIYGTGTTPAVVGGGEPTPVEAFATNNNAYLDHLTVDPRTGTVYVLYGIGGENSYATHPPLGVANRLYVARLEEGSFRSYPVHLGGDDESAISGFNWMTVDGAGTLYVLANGDKGGHHSTRLSYSRDKGRTWSKLVDLARPGAANVFGSIAGGGPGSLALVYLRGSLEDPNVPQNWFVELADISRADTPTPRVHIVRPLRKPMHTEDICFNGIACGLPGFGENRDLLDYIWNAVTPDGRQIAVIASDGPASNSNGRVDVIVLRQTSGPKLGRGAPS